MPDFIKRSIKSVPGAPDAKKSSVGKRAWGRNRATYVAGIRKFHRSIEGQKLHRKMGRFMATRNTLPKSDFKGALRSVRKELHTDVLKEHKYMVRQLPRYTSSYRTRDKD